jgi:uncharacterized membrane protein YedE/YeeE
MPGGKIMSDAATQIPTLVVGGGLAIGLVFGLVASRSNFCTMGALSDIVNMGHWGRMRMWLLAIAVAVAGTTALSLTGQIDVSKAVTQRPTLPWLSLLVGGLVFGVGMTLAGGCANKNLLRLGGGSLRSLVVLVFLGISAYMTLKGLFGQWRADWLDPVAIDLGSRGWGDQGLGTALARVSGLAGPTALTVVAGALVLALLVFVFKDKRFRSNGNHVMSGILLGAVVVAGWYISGHIGFGENPETLEFVYFATNTRTIESISFVAPIAFSLELLMLWTDASLHLSFGIASAIGVVLGSALHALATRKFRLEGFANLSDLKSQLLGGVLMGFGGVTAQGCTVGQGLTGLSTLAMGSFLAVGGIVAGGVGTLRYLLWKAEREA